MRKALINVAVATLSGVMTFLLLDKGDKKNKRKTSDKKVLDEDVEEEPYEEDDTEKDSFSVIIEEQDTSFTISESDKAFLIDSIWKATEKTISHQKNAGVLDEKSESNIRDVIETEIEYFKDVDSRKYIFNICKGIRAFLESNWLGEEAVKLLNNGEIPDWYEKVEDCEELITLTAGF